MVITAAVGIVALESRVDRLAEDHANARKLAEGLRKISGISIGPDSLPTNIVRFDMTARETAEIDRKLNERGVKGVPFFLE